MTNKDIGVLADHIASEAVHRITNGIALGTPSLHNMIREAAIDTLDTAEPQLMTKAEFVAELYEARIQLKEHDDATDTR